MNYITKKIKNAIEAREYRRQKAVFLAGRIKKSNQSPGFDWDKAVDGFANQFSNEVSKAVFQDKVDYPEHPVERIEWVKMIVYFADQPYSYETIDDVPPSRCDRGECHGCKREFDCHPLTQEEL